MRTNPWLPYNQFDSTSPLRLFCFHHSGGVASMFRLWQKAFGSDIEICPVQLPGREGRFQEPLITSMPELAIKMSQGLKPYFDVPFAFFGHSLGGLVAFELSRQLVQENIHPLFVCISACTSPRILRSETKLHLMTDKDLIEKLKAYGATSEKVLEHPELLAMVLPRIRADFQLFETYQYQSHPIIKRPIIVFGGKDDLIVPPENLYGWKDETNSIFNSQLFEGGHFYLDTAREELAMKLKLFSYLIRSSNG